MDDDRILRIREVLAMTGLTKSVVYDQMAKGRFPMSLRIGNLAVGWRLSDVQAWIKSLKSKGEQA